MQGEHVTYKWCEKTGHEAANRFELVWHPIGWSNHERRGSRNQSRGRRGRG